MKRRMKSNMKVLVVIPARSGSRRVKDKNIRLLHGKPLMSYTIEAAVEAFKHLPHWEHDIVVSTDSDKYLQIAADNRWRFQIGGFIRPKELWGDCDTALVIKDALERYPKRIYDWVMTLQPTSPLRDEWDIVKVLLKLEACDQGVNSLVSVKEVSEHPAWMFRLHQVGDTLFLKSYLGFSLKTLGGLIAQDLPKLFIPNGAIYLTRREVVLRGELFCEPILPFVMEKEKSIDLETEGDFKLAEALMNVQP